MYKSISTLVLVAGLTLSTPVAAAAQDQNSRSESDQMNKVVFDCKSLGGLAVKSAREKYAGTPQAKVQIEVLRSVTQEVKERGYSGEQYNRTLFVAFTVVNGAYSELPDVGDDNERKRAIANYGKLTVRDCKENLLTEEKLRERQGDRM